MSRIRFAIPKGSLEKATFDLLRRGWYDVKGENRTYRPVLSHSEVSLKLLRPQEIPTLVAEGLHDIGISGQDWIRETSADVEVLHNLQYGKINIIVAVPRSSKAKNLEDLLRVYARNRRVLRISTEYLNIASEHLKSLGFYSRKYGNSDPRIITPWWKKGENKRVKIFLSFGATEAKPPEDADAIIDVTETGTTIEQNNLRIIDTVMVSWAVLIANKAAMKDKKRREKILDTLTLIRGVVDGRSKLHIFINVKKKNLKALLSKLPSLKNPTVSSLADGQWCSVNTVVEREAFLKLLPTLRKLAQGLVVHEPQQILPLEEIAKNDKG
ncbi:MAG: ATP phosphoribosyltransferase [Nitrososphaerales archaeon]